MRQEYVIALEANPTKRQPSSPVKSVVQKSSKLEKCSACEIGEKEEGLKANKQPPSSPNYDASGGTDKEDGYDWAHQFAMELLYDQDGRPLSVKETEVQFLSNKYYTEKWLGWEILT